LERIESLILRQHKLSHVYLTLSSAVLYGEKICKDSIELKEVDFYLLADFVKGGPA
jgi:hypothetical protein